MKTIGSGLAPTAARDCPGQVLPAPVSVTAGTTTADGEDDVEEENSVPRPSFERDIRGYSSPEIGLQLPEDRAQRSRVRDARRHREGQAVRLARPVIQVLPEDHGPNRPERRQSQGGEDIVDRRVHLVLSTLALE